MLTVFLALIGAHTVNAVLCGEKVGYSIIPCEDCSGMPIEVIAILDDSSSITAEFPTEQAFGAGFVTQVDALFGIAKQGAVFFSSCMHPDMAKQNAARCATGTQDPYYPMMVQSERKLNETILAFDHGQHIGTPLSFGYDWSRAEMIDNGTPGRLRVIMMITDGHPTYPTKWKGWNCNGDCEGSVSQTTRIDWANQNVTVIKDIGVISLTVNVKSAHNDYTSKENMRRWASRPRKKWAIEDVQDFDTLNRITLPLIVDLLCFYIKSVTPDDCIEVGTVIAVEGKNLYSMAPGIDPSLPKAGVTAWLENNLYEITSNGNKNAAQMLQLDKSGLEGLTINNGANTYGSDYDEYIDRLYEQLHEEYIAPQCRFTYFESGPNRGDIFFVDATPDVKDGEDMFYCPMPETNLFGRYVLEISRAGKDNATFTTNNRIIAHTAADCRMPTLMPSISPTMHPTAPTAPTMPVPTASPIDTPTMRATDDPNQLPTPVPTMSNTVDNPDAIYNVDMAVSVFQDNVLLDDAVIANCKTKMSDALSTLSGIPRDQVSTTVVRNDGTTFYVIRTTYSGLTNNEKDGVIAQNNELMAKMMEVALATTGIFGNKFQDAKKADDPDDLGGATRVSKSLILGFVLMVLPLLGN